MYSKPTKKPKTSKLTDYYAPSEATKKPTNVGRKISASMKPSPRKVSGKKRMTIASDDEDEDAVAEFTPPPARAAPPKRAARTTAKKYIDVTSEDEEVKEDDYSLFEDE
jgi:hypothetical protein